MKNNKEKRKISVLTVFIWIFLVITMTTIVVNDITNNNALEGENINNNSNKIETNGYYFIQREVFKGNNCLVKDISDLPADYSISCTITNEEMNYSNTITKRLEEASYGIDENNNFYLEWNIELPSDGIYNCAWQTSGINMEGYDISTSYGIDWFSGNLGYSINMIVSNSSTYNNYLHYNDLEKKIGYDVFRFYDGISGSSSTRISGYIGDEINVKNVIENFPYFKEKIKNEVVYKFDEYSYSGNNIITLNIAEQYVGPIYFYNSDVYNIYLTAICRNGSSHSMQKINYDLRELSNNSLFSLSGIIQDGENYIRNLTINAENWMPEINEYMNNRGTTKNHIFEGCNDNVITFTYNEETGKWISNKEEVVIYVTEEGGGKVSYVIKRYYYIGYNNEEECIDTVNFFVEGYIGEEINLKDIIEKNSSWKYRMINGTRFEFGKVEYDEPIVTIVENNQEIIIKYVLKLITVTWLNEDGTRIKQEVLPKDVTEDEIFELYPENTDAGKYWGNWIIDKEGNIDIYLQIRGTFKYSINYKWEGLPENNDIVIPVDNNSYNKGDKVKIDTNYKKGTVVKVNDIEYEFSGWSSEDVEISDDYEITIPEKNVIMVGEWKEKKKEEVEKIKIQVEKKWEDSNNKYGKRPQNVILQVKNGENIEREIILNEINNWKCEIELPRYDELGNEIKYSVDEKETPDKYEKVVDGYTVINRYINDKKDVFEDYNLPNTSDINIAVYVLIFVVAVITLIIVIVILMKNKSKK